jgi:predicted alpha-1,2-mannosidase
MRNLLISILFLSFCIFGCDNSDDDNSGAGDTTAVEAAWVEPPYVDYVDPFIGTGGVAFGHGSAVVGAISPFGMARISPDSTMPEGAVNFHHFSGYYYEDTMINGFSHLHFHGTGATDYGSLLMMPTDGFDNSKITEEGYRSSFDKQSEFASPGYYSVVLDEGDIQVELTTSGRAGIHRYTFPAQTTADGATVVIDGAHMVDTGRTEDISFEIDPASHTVSGSHHAWGALSGRSGGYDLYWVIEFDRPFTTYGTWVSTTVEEGSTEVSDPIESAGVYLNFDMSGGGILNARVGISWVDLAGARTNLEQETPGFDFDGLASATEAIWEQLLSRVRVAGGSEDERTMFYTAMYHSLVMPTIISDADGRYIGFDQEVHTADGFDYYTDFSIWDTFRTLHPWLTLVYPEYQSDMIRSLLKMYEQDDFIPIWPAGLGDAGCMIGANGEIVIADSYVKGIRDYDVDLAYEAVRRSATEAAPPDSTSPGRRAIDDYLTLGYVSTESKRDGTSMTLEYAASDFAVAEFARALGKEDDAQLFDEHSKYYANLWDPETGFFRSRLTDGSFRHPFDPDLWVESDYTEATAWQYLWYVPHDAVGFMELMGGQEAFLDRLEDFFARSLEEEMGLDDISSMLYRTYYWHGNEPDIHAVYFFNDAGRQDLLGKWLRWIIETNYTTGPDGIPGNDDCGTMSAWLTFSSLGIYPLPGKDFYYIGSPIFEAAEIDLPNGNVLSIKAAGAGPEKYYTSAATLNGVNLQDFTFTHSEIAGGGELILEMSGD